MAENPGKNIFSMAIDDLRAKKAKILSQKAEEEANVIATAARKRQEEQRLYSDWLEKAEEIFVEDCFEAIRDISEDDFAAVPSGTISFSSEAFIWFKERIYPMPLARPRKVNDLTERDKRMLAREGTAWRLHFGSGHQNRIQVEREIQNKLNQEKRLTWFDKKVGIIYDRICGELKKEKFDLVTEDGVDFVLHWRSN